jgi:hypothetical protein
MQPETICVMRLKSVDSLGSTGRSAEFGYIYSAQLTRNNHLMMNVKYAMMLIVVVLLSSCQGFRHSDFSKRKYLKLEPCAPTSSIILKDVSGSVELTKETGQEHIDPVTPLVQIDVRSARDVDSVLVPAITFNTVGRPEKKETVPKALFRDPPGRSFPDRPLSESKNEPGHLFKCGLMMILLAFLLAGMSFAASTSTMMLIYMILSAGLFIAAWIVSIVFLRKVKVIPRETWSNTLVIQYVLAVIVNVIGWTILGLNILFWLGILAAILG